MKKVIKPASHGSINAQEAASCSAPEIFLGILYVILKCITYADLSSLLFVLFCFSFFSLLSFLWHKEWPGFPISYILHKHENDSLSTYRQQMLVVHSGDTTPIINLSFFAHLRN